ncbi:MAG: DUF4198 domain-containing protein, partial [Muribaculaceae bacterium]|nr:DUF4198 domain-containing protein [Muribaculaceae bacterium]
MSRGLGFVYKRQHIDTISYRMEQQKWLYPQERVSISTDAEAYAAGDTIHMDVSLLNSSSLQSSDLSRFVYVELSDPFGSTNRRVKLKNTGEQMNGYITLPSEMAEGVYTLTGYTRFMESTGPDSFFTKPVYIYGNGRPDNNTSFSFSQKGDILKLSADLGSDSRPAIIEISTSNDKTFSSLRKKRNHTFELKQDEWKNGVVKAKIGNYGVFVPLPPDTSDLRVKIIPEGGNLVPEIINTVGLRISDGVGRGIKIKGMVVDGRGDLVASFETDRYGFGSFKFVPETAEKYQAVIGGKAYSFPSVGSYASTLQVNALRKDAVSIVPVGNVPDNAMLLIHRRGNLIYYGAVKKDDIYTFKKEDLPAGVNEMCLLDGDLNTLSRRLIYIESESEHGELLDGDIPGFSTQAYGYEINFGSGSGRSILDNIMLGTGQWNNYDIPSVIKGNYDNPSAELEVGGEISGTVKSRWRGKPLADAEVSIISSDIDYWNATKTDSDGHFILNGVDWPEGTRFVVKVVNEKGDYEDNYTIEDDSFPEVNHIVPAFEGDVYVAKELDNAEIRDKLSKWLDEVEVTAIAKNDDDDDITKIYEIIGGRTVDQDYFDSRAITTYEAAIRAFPGLVIQNGKVICSGGGRGKDVEIWVDGVKWVPPYDTSGAGTGVSVARRQAAMNTANIMTGGLLPSDLALAQYEATQSSLSDLAASFPFSNVDKIIYLRPATALIVSNHAGFAGGALMIYTKNKNPGKYTDYNLHLKVISPLGYQK